MYFAHLMKRDYNTDTLNLEDLSTHNYIEHDASMTRSCSNMQLHVAFETNIAHTGQDTALVADQSKPDLPLVNALLDMISGPGGYLTAKDLSRYSFIRRKDAKASNPNFTLDTTHKLFGSSK
jgi:hypothetical protein